ncbi:hypothetical protein Q7C36_003933 [Tachysurus vachellii]|uniref:Nuclear body protein SP140-like protein n=1 Tax=Tachysurus vachellii TaxID=175792 RepID=A0AA88T7W6_TACVA|nr:hypothetical protein Q7C36_003933 [Tachysurus vachellii]
MDQLNSLTHDELVRFFRRKKAEISCMEEPHIFLRQLRDHDLVPEDLYKVTKRRSKKRIEDGSFRNYIKLPNAENPSGSNEGERQGKNQAQTKKAKKRKIADKKADEEEAGPSSGTRQKKADTEPMSSLLLHRGEVLVTCGDKRGTLDPDKLGKGEKCIFSEDRWFSPGEFERFSGKGSCKNWKTSIRYQNTTLQKLIKDGHLKCPRIYRRSRSKTDESSDEYITDEEEEEEEEGEEEEEENSETAHLSTLPTLPVSCGSVSGVLHKSRFSGGSRSKSIRTEERWFTPEEFVKQELTLTDGHWKKDILCHGKTLDYLVKKKILCIHSVQCKCDCCDPKDPLAQNNDDVCFICDSDGELVCCDECPRAFHNDCHLPPTHNNSSGDKWMCTFCEWKINQRMWMHMSLEQVLKSPINQNIMRCEYLLLCLYKEDVSRVFTKDPLTTVSGYSSVRSNPMWLDRVKDKLQRKLYTTVGEFVDDIRLIFQNRDKDVGMLGSRLSEIFEQKFLTCFKIQ